MLVPSRWRGHHACCSVVHTETVEDYLKAIFELVTRTGGATTSTLAERLGVAAPTVSAMLKRLAPDDLVARQGAHRVTLTEHGMSHALAVVRRHRLIEEFLVKVLDVPWEDVHAEAEVLEHAVSDRLLDRIDDLSNQIAALNNRSNGQSAKGQSAKSASPTNPRPKARKARKSLRGAKVEAV